MKKRPHLILILTDQQRGDCLGLAGHLVLSTPNLDELGGCGAFVTRAYSEVPSCLPARRILLSGQNQVSNRMIGMQAADPDWNPPHTLPGELTKAGYQTHLVGKLHFFPYRKRYGFQSMIWSDGPLAQMGAEETPDDYHNFLRRKGFHEPFAAMAHGVDPNGWVGRPWHLEERFHFTNWCVDEANDFLQRRDPTTPFFLNISIFAPHPPLTPPEFYYNRYMQMDLPPVVVGDWVESGAIPSTGAGAAPVAASRVRMDPATLKRCRAAYYGLINHVDDQIGRFFMTLKQTGLWNDCFILFASDHGEMLGDHHMYRKTYAYEASAHVPFLLHAPGWMECKAGLRLNQVVGLQDVMPTMLDAASIAIPQTADGKSLLPLMRGESVPWREFLHGEHSPCYMENDGVQFITDGMEKYIWHTRSGREQFFDLRSDPSECHDLAQVPQHAVRVESWRQRMIRQLKERPEGFSNGKRLVAGRPHQYLVPHSR